MTFWFLSSAVLLAALIGLRFLLRGRVSPALQYALWLLALLRLLIPGTVFSTPASLQNLTGQTQIARDMETIEDVDLIFYREDNGTVEGWRPGQHWGNASVVLAEDAGWEDYSRLDQTRHWKTVLTGVWLVGACAVGGTFLASNLSFARRLRRSRRAVDIPRPLLPVYVCEGLKTPCLFGLLRPSIYITPEVESDETKLRHVLAHEETHYRHGDFLWGALRGMCLALHWFDPLAWWAAKLSRQDAETACDAGAIRRLGEDERADYGRTLIGLTARRAGRFDMLSCATTMTGGKKAIKERITMIAKNPKTKIAALVVVIAAVAVAGLCLFTGAKEDIPVALAETDPEAAVLQGKILAIETRPEGLRFLIEVTEDSGDFRAGDTVSVAGRNMEPSPEPMTGDLIEVTYRVDRAETKPAHISDVTGIRVVERADAPDAARDSAALPGQEAATFLRLLETSEFDWGAAIAADGDDVMALLSVLREYVGAHELSDQEFTSLLKNTNGLDGAYAEGFQTVLDALYAKDPNRYLDLWETLTVDRQNAALPFAAFTGGERLYGEMNLANAMAWMWLRRPATTMSADLDHDGVEERILVCEAKSEGVTMGATVTVVDGSGAARWTLNTAHAGWGSIFLCRRDGQDSLLFYRPNYSTGVGEYYWELSDLQTGVLQSDILQFATVSPNAFEMNTAEMAAFAEEINGLLEQSVLVASTDGGTLRVGPASAEPYYERFSVFLDDGRVLYPAGATLAEKLEIYKAWMRSQGDSAVQPRPEEPDPAAAPAASLPAETPAPATNGDLDVGDTQKAFAAAYRNLRVTQWRRDTRDRLEGNTVEFTYVLNSTYTEAQRSAAGDPRVFVIDCMAWVRDASSVASIYRMVIGPAEGSDGYMIYSEDIV